MRIPLICLSVAIMLPEWGRFAAFAALAVERNDQPLTLRVVWTDEGKLQRSEDLDSWVDIPDSTSPHLVNVNAGTQQYYRVSNQPFADTVIQNGKIHTLNPEQPLATTLAIRNGGIIYVGNDPATAYVDDQTDIIDAGGRVVLPGFQDAHLHLVEAGINENVTLFPQFGTESEYRTALTDALAEQPGGATEWVTGAGVNMAALKEALEFPLGLIDEIIPNRPVVILDDLGHGAWANSRALAAIGFDQLTEDPPGGIIDIVPETGTPTGIVFESAAQTLIDAAQPPTPTNLEIAYEQFHQVLELLAKNGITTVSDAGGYWPRGHHTVWTRAEREGTLTVRANNAFYVYPDKPFAAQVASITQLQSNDPDKLVRFNQVKLYVDGIISQATAALVEPYAPGVDVEAPENRGFLYFDDTLDAYAAAFDAAGFQLHFHATGDRGTRLALDAISHAQTTNQTTDRRHRITHVYMVHPTDINRFAQLGVFADFQLAPSSLTVSNLADAEFFIGDRVSNYLPARTLLDAGAELTLSSDFDADELSPFVKIETVVARPSQGIPDVPTAVRLMTLQPAKLLHHEQKTGTLEVGKYADLIIIDQDIFTIPIPQIGKTTVLLTMLGGEQVFRSADF